jgi:hypothetical protein
MIDITKQYRTRDGREVTGLREARNSDEFDRRYTIVGYINGRSKLQAWTENGQFMMGNSEHESDLIGVLPEIDFTKPLQTNGGINAQPVTLITTTGRGNYPVIGYIGDSAKPTVWTARGKKQLGLISSEDLMNVPPQKIVRYVNCYQDDAHKGFLYESRDKADRSQAANRIACVRIEFTEGQFDN